MKKLTFIALLLMPFLFLNISCGSSSKEKQNNTESTPASSLAPATAVETSSPAPVAAVNRGEKLFKDNGCVVCHQLDTKVIGPPLKEVAVAYKDNKKGLNEFLKGNAKSIIDPAQHAIMEPQIAITKAMSEEDRMAIVDYLLSVK
jgi:cytochrome c551/c552